MDLARFTMIHLRQFTRSQFKTKYETIVAEMAEHNLAALARSSRQTSDPRDQVYSRITSSTGFMFLGIKPDYTLTTKQVFIATTTALLHASQSWAHQQFFIPSESPFLPSWAIDFSLAPEDMKFGSTSHFPQGEFKADGMASFRLKDSQSGSLSTAGFIYDDVVVAATSDRFGDDDALQAWAQVLAAEGSFQYIKRNHAYSTAKDLAIAYYRTRCMGVVGPAKFGPEHAAVILAAAFNNEELDGDRSSLFKNMNYRGRVHYQAGMKLIITRKGHLGLAARRVNVGDRIAILATGSVPFALRKVSEQTGHDAYILLGGCYVDGKMSTLQYVETRDTNEESPGIMNGEAVGERLTDLCLKRSRHDLNLALWRQEHPELISWNSDLDQMDVNTDLAFMDDICLV